MPGMAEIMPLIGERIWKCYYAGKAKNKPLARFQLAEAVNLMEKGMILRPKYTENMEKFLTGSVAAVSKCIESALVEPRLHRLREQDVTVGAQFEKEVLPIGEMVAGGRVRDAQAARQPPERDGIDSFLLEQEARLGKQRRSQVAVMVGARLLSTADLNRRACGAPRSHGPILPKQS